MNRSLHWLTQASSREASVCGNKAANLARLLEHGFPVPNGFCVTTNRIEQSLSQSSDEIRAALNQFLPPWIVRSSSTAEDGMARAYPGVFLTVPGLRTPDDVLAAIDQVADSSSGPLVSRYEDSDNAGIAMSVLVQPMVHAVAAGVAFTRHPVTFRNVVVVEAGVGLGEPVVDGSITPDTLEVAEDGTVTLVRLGSKKEKLVLVGDQVERVATTSSERQARVLSDDEAREVAQISRKIESYFGTPQDVEWALDDQRTVVILQSRPITTGPITPEGS